MVSGTLVAQDILRVFTDANDNEITALESFSLTVEGAEVVGIVGPSGCGKSTFLRLVAGLDNPQSGMLTYNDNVITKPDPHRGLVFQNAALFEWLTVYENIAFGLRARKVYKEQKDRIQPLIDQMGLTGFEQYYPHQISGGMASRTALARSFIQDPGVVLLDEPLSSLDAFTRATIQDQIIAEQQRSPAIILLVTHDIEEAVYLCDRIAVMSPRPGRIIGEVKVALDHPRDRTSEEFIALRKRVMHLLETA
jgi:sulfonate transport system ATP-binding protein